MDKDAIELALQGLETYSEELSPLYEALREQLVGRLSLSQRTFEGMQHEAERSRANVELLQDTALLLPSSNSSSRTPTMFVSNPYTARAIQATTLWYTPSPYCSADPYFIVGEQQVSKRKTKLLLQPAAYLSKDEENTTELVTSAASEITIGTENFRKSQDHRLKQLGVAYTQDQLTELFHHDSGLLRITGSDTMTALVGLLRITCYSNLEQEQRRLAVHTRHYLTPLKYGLSDLELARYNVPHHLNRLATIFGVTDAFAKILESYQEDFKPAPIEELFEEKPAETQLAEIEATPTEQPNS